MTTILFSQRFQLSLLTHHHILPYNFTKQYKKRCICSQDKKRYEDLRLLYAAVPTTGWSSSMYYVSDSTVISIHFFPPVLYEYMIYVQN